MMFELSIFNLFLLTALGFVGSYLYLRPTMRSAQDVAEDLSFIAGSQESQSFKAAKKVCDSTKRGLRASSASIKLDDELGQMGLLTGAQRTIYTLRRQLTPFVAAAVFVSTRLLFFPGTLAALVFTGLIGLAAGYLYEKYRLKKLKDNFKREIEFFLPIVMERIVMAVQSGFDVFASVKVILDLDENQDSKKEPGYNSSDPVSRLLSIAYSLTESGLAFEQSLKEVSSKVNNSALRHAFIYLALAQKEGGELIMPLRELSDSTQLYYQESVEEQIAAMPARATLPLLCTFLGLIIFFLTAPLLQVTDITNKARPEAQGGPR
jgi:Flp pilus assembly protein TadB